MKQQQLKQEWERKVLQELYLLWESFNETYFEGVMRRPLILVQESKTYKGLWEASQRCITLSLDCVSESSWLEVGAVLKHEMTHQYIEEVLKVFDQPPHGPLFRKLCQDKGIESPEQILGHQVSEDVEDSSVHLRKIRKLLSLASSPNPHEAENAMQMANRLMLEWNISEVEEERQYVVHQIGRAGRVNAAQKMLSVILQEFFFVEALWVSAYDVQKQKSGRVLEVCGSRENVEIAVYVWDFLIGAADRFFKIEKKLRPELKKSNYIYGLLLGFYEKLDESREEQAQTRALVYTGDPQLKHFFKKRYPRTRSMTTSKMALEKDSFEAGREQGRKVVIHKGIHGQSSSGKLLGDGH